MPASPAPAGLGPDVHEEVTVAREKPDLSAFKTMMDASPFGASRPAGRPATALLPTPVVPAPETQAAPVVVQPAAAVPNLAKTEMLSQTVSDPAAADRARAMVDAAMAVATTHAAPAHAAPAHEPGAPAAAGPPPPRANLHKTMVMGGESPAPEPEPATAPPPAPQAHRAIGDSSPLSKSVLAPQSWLPPAPAPGVANMAPTGTSIGTPPPPRPTAPSSPPAPAPGTVDVARVVSIGPPGGAPQAPSFGAPAPPPAPGPAPGAPPTGGGVGAPALRTMLGMPASELGIPQGPPAPQGGPPGPPGPGGLAMTMPLTGAPPNVQKTMLGVAIPGIAPTHEPQGQPPFGGPQGQSPPSGGPVNLQSKQSTMLGVAIPGIAPTHTSAPPGAGQGAGPGPGPYAQPQHPPAPQRDPRVPSQVQNTALGMMVPPEVKIVPRPKTLIDEPLPVAPQIPQKKGVSALLVVGILIVFVAIAGGGVAFYALRNSGTLTAVPQLDENGRESLKIGCTSCPDGTTVSLGASSATVTAGAAVLPLPAPLSIGENDLGVKLERPAGGRHEEVKVHVPVAYRVRADLATLSARPPAITVRVESTPGSVVTVDGKPLALDATGRGSYAIELGKETDGTGEAKTFERKIPFAITPKGGKEETGQLTARTSIVPLALDAPGHELITDKTSAAVAGQTRPGSVVTIEGQNVAVDPTGRFGVRVELPNVGDKPLEIVASAPPLAPRIAKVKVTRVASLAEAAKAEDAQSPMGFDGFGADPASKVGQLVVVEGDVVDARASAGHTVLLVEDKKKCAKGVSCLVRVVHGDEDRAARGDIIRVYGHVLGSVTASGKTVPDIEGVLLLPVKAAK